MQMVHSFFFFWGGGGNSLAYYIRLQPGVSNQKKQYISKNKFTIFDIYTFLKMNLNMTVIVVWDLFNLT